jgi:hypothetical protein
MASAGERDQTAEASSGRGEQRQGRAAAGASSGRGEQRQGRAAAGRAARHHASWVLGPAGRRLVMRLRRCAGAAAALARVQK